MFQLGIGVPTGNEVNGNGVAFIAPQYQFWCNIYGNWAMRGFTGVTVPTNHAKTSGYTSYNNNLAIGRYFKGSDDGWIQQFWVYIATVENSTISGPRPRGPFLAATRDTHQDTGSQERGHGLLVRLRCRRSAHDRGPGEAGGVHFQPAIYAIFSTSRICRCKEVAGDGQLKHFSDNDLCEDSSSRRYLCPSPPTP